MCSLLVFNVERHIIFQHSATETVVEDDSATEIDEEIFELEETSFPEKASKISTHGSLVERQIVLVQRKSLHWLAKIVSVSSNRSEVLIFDKARTIDEVHYSLLHRTGHLRGKEQCLGQGRERCQERLGRIDNLYY